jgi:hypothetical protein
LDAFDLADDAELVDIPVPAAPKKPRGAVQATTGMKAARNIKCTYLEVVPRFLIPLTHSLAIKPFAGTILESDSSETESETPDELEDASDNHDSANDSDGETQGNNPGNTMVLSMGKPRAVRKQQLDEVCQN